MSEPNYVIRTGRAEDADALSILWTEMGEDHRAYDPEVWCWSKDARDRWEDGYLEWIDDKDMCTVLAEDERGKLVGYAVAHAKDSPAIFETTRTGEVWDLCVTAGHRHRGLGVKLMEAVFEWLKASGADDVILHVALHNPAALQLYRKLGMRSVMYRMYKRL